MRKLQSILKSADRTLKVWESKGKLRGEVWVNGTLVMSADFFEKDGDAQEQRVREYFNFNNFYRVPFERKNGKIVLYPVNKQKRIIWSNENWDEWYDAMMEEGEYTEEELTYEFYNYCCDNDLSDERMNLDKEVDGCIIAFADLGLWNGRVNGGKVIGTNVKDILYSDCDYCTWYCDPYNVKCDAVHHDGRNHILYRVAESRAQAEVLVNKIAYHGMTEEQFRHATKSLRPYVAKVYGW